MDFRLALPPEHRSASIARLAMDDWLSKDLEEDVVADARLGVSELVTNAVRHGGLGAGDGVLVDLTLGPEDLRIVVSQPTLLTAPVPMGPLPGPNRTHGMGLVIIDELATRWGSEPRPPGRVWFELSKIPGAPGLAR
jgi:anti-sigma regulatory factor (Ser/Thr protein kinase)